MVVANLKIKFEKKMSVKTKEVLKDDIVQAVVVADTFGDEFLPISSDIPLVCVKNRR